MDLESTNIARAITRDPIASAAIERLIVPAR
jgi:hypothetical protein